MYLYKNAELVDPLPLNFARWRVEQPLELQKSLIEVEEIFIHSGRWKMFSFYVAHREFRV